MIHPSGPFATEDGINQETQNQDKAKMNGPLEKQPHRLHPCGVKLKERERGDNCFTAGAAAASLGVVPSALSGVIRQLEAQIGAPLFDRSTRPPSIIPLGRDHAGIDCMLHNDIAEELALMVSDGRLDIAIAGRAQHSPDLRQREVMQDMVGMACRADHPSAA